jgi:DNA polymerase III alpha subunit
LTGCLENKIYFNYHRHSAVSNIITPDSVTTNKEYLKRTLELGHTALASTEHGFQGDYLQVYDLAKENNLKFVFGVEAYFVKDRLEKDKTNAHIVLVAKNEKGRRALNSAIAESWISGFYYKNRLDYELLLSLPDDSVYVTTACVGGIFKYKEDYEDILLKLKDKFKDDLFLEVQCHNTDSQKELNSKILELSKKYGIRKIFGADSHYIYPQDSKERDNFLLSKKMVYEDENNWYMDFPSYSTVVDRFSVQNILSESEAIESLENTKILQEVEEYDSPIFNKEIKMPSIYPDKTQEEKDKILEDIVWKKWQEEKQYVDQSKLDLYESEIKKELSVVVETFHSDYFLLNHEIIKKGREIGGILTNSGRGSAVSFIINKLLGFTEVDRIEASEDVVMYPERFMSKTRILESKSLADIDFNCSNPEVFAIAQKKVLGEESSYPMIAYGTLGNKAAWKMFSRSKEIDFDTANQVSEEIDKLDLKLKHTEDDEKEFVDAREFISDDFYDLYEESKKYLGIVSDVKIAPCGYLLYSGNIREEIGLIRIKSANGKEHLCAVIDGKIAESHHFLKNDLLKVAVVDLINKTYSRIGLEVHKVRDLLKITKNDEPTWNIYAHGKTYGINQVEQKGTTSKATKYKPKNIAELCALIAAVRPGFASMYKKFESREPFSYGIKSFDDIIQTKTMKDSFILYQEQLMTTLNFSGMDMSECYDAIKNIAKKRVEKVKALKDGFLDGFSEKIKTVEQKTEEEACELSEMVWQIISDASAYSFNSSHSYCMAIDSLYGAYLKSHYPFEFYETFLRMLEEDADKDRLTAVKNEATSAFGIIFPPFRFGQDNRTIVAKKKENQITSSLASIKGFGKDIGENMYQLGLNHYDTFVDFLIDIEEKGMFTSKIDNLIDIKYFDCFGGNKKLSIFYKEFTKGKNRYSAKHSEKTKAKRIEELRKFWNEIPNENFSIGVQIEVESDILGYVQATYPVDKRYFYVKELDTVYSPRFEAYCLATGKSMSLKIQKKKYYSNPFGAGEILYGKKFTKKPAVKFVDNKYVEDENGEMTWWLDDFEVIPLDKFDKIVSESLTKT